MVLVLVQRQNETPYLATTRLGIRTLVLVRTRFVEQHVLVLRSVIPVRPVVAVVVRHAGTRFIHLLGMVDNIDIHHRVAGNIIRVTTALAVGLTVEGHALVAADGERRVQRN